jgi:hypothetical protein
VQHDRPQIGCERDAASDERYLKSGKGRKGGKQKAASKQSP